MNVQEFIDYRLTQKNFIHDFSLGALFTYHKILDLYEENRVEFNQDYIWFKPTKKVSNLFFYNDNLFPVIPESKYEGRADKLKVSAAFPIEFLGKKSLKQEEVFYQLHDITKHNGKKHYHSFNKPVNIIENRPDLDITLEDLAGQAGLNELHDEWVKYKLSLPKTYRISFPTARYRNTLRELPIPMYCKAIYIKGKLYGYIIFSIENEVAFELAFVTLYWKEEFKILNGLNQYIFSYCLIDLLCRDVKFVNSGFALNKNLKMFKQMSQKSNSVYRYAYTI